MGKITLMILFVAIAFSVRAQEDQSLILEGNQLYKEKEYDKAIDQYQKATNKDEKNPKAKYNLGNALYRSDKKEAAQKAYDAAADAAKDANIKSKALYNKGVAYSNEKKLPESIDAYKEALKINPADNEARENLQKALNELKKQQPPPPKQDQKKNDKQDQKKNDQQKQNNTPQNNSKLNQKQAEKMLNALRQQEKKLQQDQQKKTNTGGMQEKDW